MRVKATLESIPAFSARVRDSAMISIVPRIREFPKSLSVGAVNDVERTLQYIIDSRTLFDIPSEIDDLSGCRGNEKVGNFLLRTIVAAHYRNQQALRCGWGSTKDRTRNESGMRHGGDQIIQFT